LKLFHTAEIGPDIEQAFRRTENHGRLPVGKGQGAVGCNLVLTVADAAVSAGFSATFFFGGADLFAAGFAALESGFSDVAIFMSLAKNNLIVPFLYLWALRMPPCRAAARSTADLHASNDL